MASTTTLQVVDKTFNREWLNAFVRKYAIVLIFIAMFITMTFLTDAFLQPRNLVNVVRQISVVGLIAIGVTFLSTWGPTRRRCTTPGLGAITPRDCLSRNQIR